MDGTEEHGGIPIAQAAERLGVTVELLRKRAQRGTIPAYKQDGKWFVAADVLDSSDAGPGRDGQDGTSRPGQDTASPTAHSAVSPAARSQLEAIRDEWLAPLVAQIRGQAEQIGRLEERLAATERERDRLAVHLSTDRALTDQLVAALERERDAAAKASDALRDEVASLRAAQHHELGAAAGQGGATAPDPAPESLRENARPGPSGEATGAQVIGPPAWRIAAAGHELGPDRDEQPARRPWWRFWGR